MALDLLKIDGDSIGDCILAYGVLTAAQTPPAVQVGVLQADAAVNAESINLLRVWQFRLQIERDTYLECAQAVAEIKAMANRQGLIQVYSAGELAMTLLDWTIQSVQCPELDPGFAGRYTKDLVVVCVGVTAEEY